MQNLITTPADYWIAPTAVSITLNALEEKNRIQGSVASGAVIMCFIDEIRAETDGGEPGNGDGLWYGANHEPRRWPLTISPTYFNSDTRKYVYAAIPRSTQVGTQAVIVFPSDQLDIYGRAATTTPGASASGAFSSPSSTSSSSSDPDSPAQIGSTDYFYVFLGGIISAVETIDRTEQRRWERQITDWGTLETPQGRDESFSKYTFWGQSINANNQVIGSLAGSINYIEFANGVRLGVDTADNTLKVYMPNNQQAHLFSTGAVSAFGPSALGGGGGDLILGPLLSALNAEPMPTDDGYLHWTGSAFEWVEPGGGGEMPSTVAWNDITGKPSTFAPSEHTHLKEDIIDFAHTHDDRYYTESEMDDFLAGLLSKPSQGTYTKLTVASGGGVTWGTLSASDIPSLTKSKISDFPTQWAWSAISGAPFTGDVANSAAKLSDTAAYTAWGRTFFTGGKPASVSGDLDNVANITMSGHISIGSFIVEKTNDGLKHNGNVLATGAVSALGVSAQGSNSGALSLLTDVNISGTPTDGYVLTYDSTSGKWTPQATQATDLTAYATKTWVGQQGYVTSSGVTSVTAGTGLSGGTITASGTIAINSTYQTYISNGNTAYGWGNHANAGYATQTWVGQQGFLTSSAISDMATKTWVGQQGFLTGITSNMVTTALSFTPLSNATTFWGRTASNGVVSGNMTGVGSITMSGSLSINSFIVEKTSDGLKHNGNILATGAVSALGISAQGSNSGALSLLTDVNISGTPTNGYVLTYDSTSGKWTPQATQATDLTAYATKTWVGQQGYVTSSGVTSVTAGTGLSGGTITASGTIAINSTYQTYISNGNTAYGWGNHANAGYATQTWVGQQGFLTSSAISDMATKTWVGQQGFLTSSAISDMATKTWVGQQGFLTGITSNMVTTALGFTPLSNATTFWGRTASNGVVSGNMTGVGSITMSGSLSINSFIVEKTNDGLKHNGNVLATGAVSALGISAQGSNSGALSLLTDVNISGTPTDGYVLTYDSTSGKWTPQATQATDLSDYATTSALSNYLPLTGGTLTGNLIMNGNGIALLPNLNYPNIYYQNEQIVIIGPAVHVETDGQFLFNGEQVATQLWANGQFVTALGVSGDYLTWTAGGQTNNVTVPFATKTMGFKGLSVTGSQIADANTMTVGGVEYALLANYASTNLWSNMPSGMSWGNVLQLTSPTSLDGQLAWDSNHGVTTGVTRKLYWRSRNSTGWGTNGWHTIAFEDWVTTQLNTLGDNLQNYVTTQLGNYLPLTAGTSHPLTGNIAYKGTKATYDMISFIDNVGDTYGNGIAIGGGGAAIIGGGESASTMAAQVSGGSEVMYIGNDQGVSIFTNLQNGWANRKEFTFDTDGSLTTPGWVTIKANNGTGLSIVDTNAVHDFTAFWNTQTINSVSREIFTMYSYETKYWDMCIGTHPNAVGYGGLYMYNSGNNVLRWGIGTTTPDSKLHVVNECHFASGAKFNNICIEVNNSIAESGRGSEINNYNGILHLQYDSSTNCTICSGGGNVGIGTRTPSYKLDVNGAGHFSGNTAGYGILLDNDKAVVLKGSNGTAYRSLFINSLNVLSLGYGSTKLGSLPTEICGNTIAFRTGLVSNEPVERVHIDNNGNVGIGTNNPQHKLHVAGNIVANGAVSALGVSAQGGSSLSLYETNTIKLFVDSKSEFADDIMLDGKLIFGTGTSDDCIYADSGHLYFKPAGGTAVQIA